MDLSSVWVRVPPPAPWPLFEGPFFVGSGTRKTPIFERFLLLRPSPANQLVPTIIPFIAHISSFRSCSLPAAIFIFSAFLTPDFARYSVIFRTFGGLFRGPINPLRSASWRPSKMACFLPISLEKMAKSRWLTPPSRNSPNGCKCCWSWQCRCVPATPGCP